MIQTIIIYIIIAGAIIYTIYSVVKSLRTKEKSGCDGCNGCDLKHEITKNLKNHHTGTLSCNSRLQTKK
ncbi:MAG: hypothetical protein H6Q20_1393 [Bacteroidetes bacterium]|nr:hypothetical protein [Bacteroidota bacterium]